MQSVKNFHLQDDSAAAIIFGLRAVLFTAVIYCTIAHPIGQTPQAAIGHPQQFQQSDHFR